jgi:hypothetical protein
MSQANKETGKGREQAQSDTKTKAAAETRSDAPPEPEIAASQQTSRPDGEPPVGFGVVPVGNIVAAQRAHFDALTRATQAFMDGLTAINREVVDFGDRRTRALLDTSKTAPAAGDWSEMWSFQVDYADRATQAYVEEATKLLDLGVRVSQESWMPLQESATTAIGELFRKADD